MNRLFPIFTLAAIAITISSCFEVDPTIANIQVYRVDEVGEKILRHAAALGGVDRVTFQMDNAELPREKLLRSIQLIGERIKPALSVH